MKDLHELVLEVNSALRRVERAGQPLESTGSAFLTLAAHHIAENHDDVGAQEIGELVVLCVGSAMANAWPEGVPLSYEGIAVGVEQMFGCNWKSGPACLRKMFADRQALIDANPAIRQLMDRWSAETED